MQIVTYQIAAAEAFNFMRLKELSYEPEADRAFVLVAGENTQGKTSLFTFFESMLGGDGAVPDDPVHHGAESGSGRLRLRGSDGSEIEIGKRFTKDGPSKLEVRTVIGSVKSPQSVLNDIIGQRSLDPLAFLNLKDGDQRARLLALIDKDGAIAKLDAERKASFDRRRDVGRDLKKGASQLDGIRAVDPGTEINVGELVAEKNDLAIIQRRGDGLNNSVRLATAAAAEADRARDISDERIKRLRAELDAEVAKREEHATASAKAHADVTAAQTALDAIVSDWREKHSKRAVEIDNELARAADHNRKVAADKASEAQRLKLKAEVDRLDAEHDRLDAEIKTIDDRKQARLERADLPVPGMGIDDNGITLNGAPFAQASSAEKLRVSLWLAAAANTKLRDIWIRDGALIDDKGMGAVIAFARTRGIRVWIERINDRGAGVLHIHDGQIASKP